jgi:hypothetical protein
MYCTAPPATARPSEVLPLRLKKVVRREVAADGDWTDDPELHEYFADLAALHGIGYRGDVLRAGAAATFAAMAEPVLAEADPVDVLIIAHTTPDLDPRVSAAAAASHRFAGRPLVFAVSDTACSVAFTAVRLAGEYVRRHSYRRALVLVLDQATRPYESPAAPGGDAVVALHLSADPAGQVRCGRVPGVHRDHVAEVAARIGGGVPVLGPTPTDGRFPATGIWRDFAAGTSAVLVHHDEARAELAYCAIGASEAS